MNENMETRDQLLVKWLRALMYIAVASLLNSALGYLPFIHANITTWISRAIMTAMIVCTFQLAPVNARYKKAAIMRTVMLACALITAFMFGSTILTLTASVVSIIAVYQEYTAHAEIIADNDEKLSNRWHSLFIWGLIAGLLLSFGATVVAMIVIMADLENASHISGIAIGLLSIPQCVIDIVYILYINKMVGYFRN